MKLTSSRRETLIAYAFLLPNFLGFLIFTSLPVLSSLILSFFRWDILSAPQFVGFDNFVRLLGFSIIDGVIEFNDPHFWHYLYNTLFLMLIIPLQIIGSLLCAMALNQKLRGIVFFRTIFFLPTICQPVALAILWRGMFNPELGLVNSIISGMGELLHLPLAGPYWLTSIFWSKPALMVVMLWMFIGGFNMILYLAALQNISKEMYDAAEIDGANNWQKFWAVTWPMISPTTFFITIMSIIGGFQGGFLLAYMMTGGGPAGSTTTLEFYIFNNLYVFQHAGYAASIAWVLFIMVFIVTLIYWRYGGKITHYY